MIRHIKKMLEKKTGVIPCLAMAAALLAATHAPAAVGGFPDEISLSDSPMTMKQAVVTALEMNRTVKSSGLNVETAEKKVKETRSQFGLDISVKGNYQRVEDSGKLSLPLTYYSVAPVTISGTNYYAITNPVPNVALLENSLNPEWQHSGELDIVQPVFTFGKRKAAISATKKAATIARHELDMEKLKLAAQVKLSFQGVVLTKQMIELRNEAVTRFEAHMSDVEKLFESGIGIKLDVIRSQTELQTAREQLAMTEKDHTLARRALNNLIGYPYENDLSISDSDSFTEIELDSLENYISTALDNRPEIKILENGREAALLMVDLEKKKPIVAFAGMWNFHSRGSMFSTQDSWRAVLSFEMPLYDQDLAAAKTAQAKIQVKDIALKKEDLLNGIKIQVEKSYLEILEAQERLETSKVILLAAEEGYRIASLSYKEGYATQLDVIDAGHNLTGAGLNFAKAKYDYEVAKAGLALACGLFDLEQ